MERQIEVTHTQYFYCGMEFIIPKDLSVTAIRNELLNFLIKSILFIVIKHSERDTSLISLQS